MLFYILLYAKRSFVDKGPKGHIRTRRRRPELVRAERTDCLVPLIASIFYSSSSSSNDCCFAALPGTAVPPREAVCLKLRFIRLDTHDEALFFNWSYS